ncbi:MAG: asparaginase domain-containing protein [Pseudomonadota bacterium]
MSERHRILVVTLGGTIALRLTDGRAQATALDAELLSAVRAANTAVSVDVHEFCALDSVDLTLGQLCELAAFLASRRERYDGFVVSTGTDTLEEVAYALHLLLDGQLSLVVTGALRPPYAESFDGLDNLRLAQRTVLDKRASGRVLVALGGSIVDARSVTKASAFRLDAFAPIYSNGDATDGFGTATEQHPNEGSAVQQYADPAVVDRIVVPILHASVGSELLPSIPATADGCVVACPGGFSMSARNVEALADVAARIPIALVSRCLHGEFPADEDPYPGYLRALEGNGFLIRQFAGLSPQKARVKLILRTLLPGRVAA